MRPQMDFPVQTQEDERERVKSGQRKINGGISSSSPTPLSRIIPSNSRTPTTCFSIPAWRPSASAGRPRDRRRPLHSNSTAPSTSFCAVAVKLNSRISFICKSSSSPGSPPPAGENDSKQVLDAFFLGKALAEALNERIESAVGEFLSTVGRLQAEQQKQVLDFQDEVLERAKRAKEKAAREALGAQGAISKSPSANITTFDNGFASETAPLSNTPSPSKDDNSTDTDPLVGISIDD